jgi:hypothetical protein
MDSPHVPSTYCHGERPSTTYGGVTLVWAFPVYGVLETMTHDKRTDQWRSDNHTCFKVQAEGCTMIYRVETPQRVRQLFQKAVGRIAGRVTIDMDRLIPLRDRAYTPPCSGSYSIWNGGQEEGTSQVLGR